MVVDYRFIITAPSNAISASSNIISATSNVISASSNAISATLNGVSAGCGRVYAFFGGMGSLVWWFKKNFKVGRLWRADDVLTKIGKCEIKEVYSYMECLAKVNSGDELPVTVLRDGKEMILKVKF